VRSLTGSFPEGHDLLPHSLLRHGFGLPPVWLAGFTGAPAKHQGDGAQRHQHRLEDRPTHLWDPLPQGVATQENPTSEQLRKGAPVAFC
jgi:hypothetical protein